MVAFGSIKLTDAMVTALKGAVIVGDVVHVADGTKAQTIKGLESRGLSDLNGELNANGVEAARQLGNDTRKVAETPADGLTDGAQVVQQGEEIKTLSESLDRSFPKTDDTNVRDTTAVEDVLRKVVDLDKPHVVPNRKDRRKARGVRAALSRLTERRRVRKMRKYGSTKIGAEVSA